MHGIAILRLFCTLKTISGFKFNQEESEMLINLIICLPPPTALGVRYVVVGLCTLVACASLLRYYLYYSHKISRFKNTSIPISTLRKFDFFSLDSTPEREAKITSWLKSLIERSSTFQTQSQCITSYGETLLLIAIHFHGHTFEPIVELVCSTLGIKVRPASLTKLKILFTQTIFPEKVSRFLTSNYYYYYYDNFSIKKKQYSSIIIFHASDMNLYLLDGKVVLIILA